MTQALNQTSMQYHCCYSQYRETHLTWNPIAHHEGVYLLSRATVNTKERVKSMKKQWHSSYCVVPIVARSALLLQVSNTSLE